MVLSQQTNKQKEEKEEEEENRRQEKKGKKAGYIRQGVRPFDRQALGNWERRQKNFKC